MKRYTEGILGSICIILVAVVVGIYFIQLRPVTRTSDTISPKNFPVNADPIVSNTEIEKPVEAVQEPVVSTTISPDGKYKLFKINGYELSTYSIVNLSTNQTFPLNVQLDWENPYSSEHALWSSDGKYLFLVSHLNTMGGEGFSGIAQVDLATGKLQAVVDQMDICREKANQANSSDYQNYQDKEQYAIRLCDNYDFQFVDYQGSTLRYKEIYYDKYGNPESTPEIRELSVRARI